MMKCLNCNKAIQEEHRGEEVCGPLCYREAYYDRKITNSRGDYFGDYSE